MRSFYNGQDLFHVTNYAEATAPGHCAHGCNGSWEPGERIAFIAWEPYSPDSWAKMHPECADSHPNNVANRSAVMQSQDDLNILGIQREMVQFIHAHPDQDVVVRWTPVAGRGERYRFRLETPKGN